MAIDFTVRSDEMFLTLVNTKTTRPLLKEELEVGTPEVGSKPERNTTVIVSAVQNSPTLEDVAEFHYNRLDLATMFSAVTVSVAITEDIKTNLDIAKAINATYNLGFSELDIIDTPIDLDAKPDQITLQAVATSLVYSGNLLVSVTYPEPPKDQLPDLIQDDGVLDGFDAPEIQ